MIKTKIKEIFASIQGEGPYIGYKQLFIRFCGCNFNCRYCDTDFDSKDAMEFSSEQLLKIVNKCSDCHSVSLTGGEPLLNVEFLKEFLPGCTMPVYLETNATLPEKLSEIINYITYVSADIKLPSATGISPKWEEHRQFFEIAKGKVLFAKVVFDDKITDEEIENICSLCKEFDIELILQPMMGAKTPLISSQFMVQTLDNCLKIYPKVRLIPQVHKFIEVI